MNWKCQINLSVYLEFTLPLCCMFLKPSTGGVWDSNGVALKQGNAKNSMKQGNTKNTAIKCTETQMKEEMNLFIWGRACCVLE